MKNHAFKYLLLLSLSVEYSFSQEITPDSKKNTHPYKNTFIESSVTKSEINNSNEQSKNGNQLLKEFHIRYLNSDRKDKYSFDLMSSVGSNISFGGFWDKYAVINFTPQISIQPVDFINIYANHYLNCLIPISGIKEYSASLILQGAAILAVDNSMKFILNNNKNWILEVVSFAAKNLLIGLLIKPSITDKETSGQVLHYENFYYSMKITF